MQAVSSFLQNGIIIVDKVVDYVPFYSIRNNVFCLIAKTILYGMERFTPSLYTKIQDSHLVTHLNEKGIGECLLLCIPFLNIIVALVRDFSGCFDSVRGPSETQQKGQSDYEVAKKKADDDFASSLKKYEDKLAVQMKSDNLWDIMVTERTIELLKKYYKGELEILKIKYGVE